MRDRKQYRLLQWYPSLLKDVRKGDTIIQNGGHYKGVTYKGITYRIEKWQLHPDFWQLEGEWVKNTHHPLQLVGEWKIPSAPSLIDKVTIKNLDIALRMVGIKLDNRLIDKIIDLVELIENKGDNASIKDVIDLQEEWVKRSQIFNT